MSAYNGTYRVDGNKLVVTVESSSIQSWNGTQRALIVEISGKRLTVTSAQFKSALNGLDVVAVNIWVQLK